MPSPYLERSATPLPGVSLSSVCCHLTVAQIRQTPKIASKILREKEVLGKSWSMNPFCLPKLWKKHPGKLSMLVREQHGLET